MEKSIETNVAGFDPVFLFPLQKFHHFNLNRTPSINLFFAFCTGTTIEKTYLQSWTRNQKIAFVRFKFPFFYPDIFIRMYCFEKKKWKGSYFMLFWNKSKNPIALSFFFFFNGWKFKNVTPANLSDCLKAWKNLLSQC